MNNSEHQPVRPSLFPVTDLTSRLFRRASEPLGVIDVHQTEQMHARMPSWLLQRLELLDSFRTRYGLDYVGSQTSVALSPAKERMPIVDTYQTAVSGNSLPSTPGQPSIMRKTVSGTVLHIASDAVPTRQFRVKRPNAISDFDRPKPSGLMESASNKSQTPERREITPPPENQSDPLPQVAEIRPQTSSSPQMHLQREFGSAGVPTPRSNNAGGVMDFYAKEPSNSDSLPRVRELPPGSASKMHLQRLLGPATASVPTQSVLARSTATQDSSAGNQTSPLALGWLPHLMETPIESAFFSAEMHLQRSHDLAEDSGSATTVQTEQTRREVSTSSSQADGKTPSSEENRHPSAVSREIRVMPSHPNPAAIVWRKVDSNGAGANTTNTSSGARFLNGPTHAGSPQLMRQAAISPSPSTVAGALPNPTTIPTAASEGSGIDIMYVAERVSRVISRQLAIERERRGKTI
jgi:hypothetical protein